MSEITKLYENAGIKPTKNWQSCLNCKLKTETRYDEWGEEYLTCDRLERPEECSDAKEYYPIFTAEKQLEILCFIVNIKHSVTFHDQTFSGDKLTLEKIQEDLAWAVNRIWKDLTEEEKQQVKEILE